MKSERLKKLEQELSDLEQWLKLGLVPKSDIDRHNEEILVARAKIEEEKERLQFLKESGDSSDFTAPKRQSGRSAYTEMPSIPDIDISESNQTVSDTAYNNDSDNTESDSSIIEESENDDTEEKTYVEEEEESFFSDRNRWRRGFKDIIDPEANEW
ncbi:MAG: hypothetical protein VX777_10760 [Chlamydiota bacterium]|nr:hypothetical protein [Chlamydiota bacterium]